LFPWREQLEGQYRRIREEILAGLNIATDGRPYLTNRHRLEGEQWEPLVNKMSWASVHLYQSGVANEKVIHKFPETLEALAGVPLATTNGRPSEVFISVLAPHTRIPEHFGVSSAILTAHLPIEVPPGCGLRVHEEMRTPEAGKLMVFDDTWEHSAWNNSSLPRVVLIFELWHPELTEAEKAAVSRTIEARQDWLKRRKVD
jgi:aspartyl/asparaginyl beta-hydroxylase (cupin superfamily)